MQGLNRFYRSVSVWLTVCLLYGISPGASGADISLADAPLFSSVTVPGNLALVLSVEYPTGIAPAYPSTTAYSNSSTFLGYFDPGKCYKYVLNKAQEALSYFVPVSVTTNRVCSTGKANPLWSGNYLNWASMQTLDAFRWILTGGARGLDSNDDTSTQTILEKSNVPAQGTHSSNTPEKTLASSYISGATPFSAWTRVVSRTWGTGVYMLVSDSSTTLASDTVPTAKAYSDESGTAAKSGTIYRLYVRVQVCTAAQPESNCVQYGSNYKPEGLMQKYQSRLRYSAFGYLNGDSAKETYPNGIVKKDGGVMRARMKFIGPTGQVPGSDPISNDNAEWSQATGVMIQNPDASDAASTAREAGSGISINYSGVMNYLNRYGKVESYPAGKGYRHFDPVGELYYTALRYFRGLGNVTAYSDLSTNVDSTFNKEQTLDGFPAITDWDDPMTWGVTSGGTTTKKTYACQKNFILGIGDVNTQYDANLPGWQGTPASGYEPSRPREVAEDPWASSTTLNVVTSSNMVGQLEGLGTLGTKHQTSVNSGRTISSYGGNATNFIAGLAYAAHTTDIRTDENMPGTQTVNTYWLDVQEYQYYVSKNIYWLATKYGGFTVPSNFSPFSTSNGTTTIPDSAWTNGDVLKNAYVSTISDKRPANYFVGSDPNTMKSSLDAAFAKISSEAAAATATALSSPSPRQASSGNANYVAGYDPSNWTGSVKGQMVSYDRNGNPTYTEVWSAASQLDSVGQANRKIVTWCGSSGVPFTAAAVATCSDSFKYVIGVSSQSASDYALYLRGDRTRELANGGVYRTRTSLLGDIVDSKINPVAAPDAKLAELYNPGYNSFKAAYASRKTVVYVGANDGMLHAFDGSVTTSGGGGELFAYIPGLIYSDSSLDTADGGLSSLGVPSFSHHFLVNGTPTVTDVDFHRTADPVATSDDWRSLLVGGLGKGGKGYYAIDVTDPAAWTSETAVAGKVLWEFSNSRMGYSYGDAEVVKTAKYGWVVVLGSGYNNSDGNAYFFFVNPRTGRLLETVAVPDGSNLAHVSAFVPDYKDGTADALYAGDLQGNVWRLDLTPATGSYATPTLIATLKDSRGTAQPVTTRPLIEIEPNSLKRYVLLGTGRLLADSDAKSTQIQSFYALIDGLGTSGAFYGGSTSLPDDIAFPITRSKLQDDSNRLNGIGSSPENVMGWYFDLSAAASGIAERVNVSPTANNGVVAFAANLPNGDACSPAGTSKVYALSMSSGQNLLTDERGFYPLDAVTTDISFINIAGKTRLLAGISSGAVVNLVGTFPGDSTPRRLNWRVIPTAD